MSPLSGRTYCTLCDLASTHAKCYYCLKDEIRGLQAALVEAQSAVAVASCLPKRDSDGPNGPDLRHTYTGPARG